MLKIIVIKEDGSQSVFEGVIDYNLIDTMNVDYFVDYVNPQLEKEDRQDLYNYVSEECRNYEQLPDEETLDRIVRDYFGE